MHVDSGDKVPRVLLDYVKSMVTSGLRTDEVCAFSRGECSISLLILYLVHEIAVQGFREEGGC